MKNRKEPLAIFTAMAIVIAVICILKKIILVDFDKSPTSAIVYMEFIAFIFLIGLYMKANVFQFFNGMVKLIKKTSSQKSSNMHETSIERQIIVVMLTLTSSIILVLVSLWAYKNYIS